MRTAICCFLVGACVLYVGARLEGVPLQSSAPQVLTVEQVFPEVKRPRRLAADDQFIYVLSGGDHSVLVYDHEFRFVRRIGRIGSGMGELCDPQDMSLAGSTLWIADSQNNRVQRFSTDGTVLSAFEAKLPWSVAALTETVAAVVGRRDLSMFKLYDANGELRLTVKDFVSTGATTPVQSASFNRGRVFAGPQGTVVYLFRGLLKPVIRWYHPTDGRRISELMVDGILLSDTLKRAAERRTKAISSGDSAMSGTLNGFTVDPVSGDMWVAPSAPVIYRYTPSGTKSGEYVLRDLANRAYGAHDIVVTPSGRLLMISSSLCITTTLPR